ncbi:iron chelate uptake ABC transporter family permease subunit [Erysipelothrix sp. D19-032]
MVVDRKQYRYLALGCLVLLGLASLFVGALDMTLSQLLAGDINAWHTLMYSRLPRVIAVILTGISVSIAGLIMQKLSQNRFVSPSTAVTMDGARLGILVAFIVLSNQTLWSISIFALLFLAISTVFVYDCSFKAKNKEYCICSIIRNYDWYDH